MIRKMMLTALAVVAVGSSMPQAAQAGGHGGWGHGGGGWGRGGGWGHGGHWHGSGFWPGVAIGAAAQVTTAGITATANRITAIHITMVPDTMMAVMAAATLCGSAS